MTTTMPLHLTGYMAPVPDEIDAVDLPVDGVLPPELRGRYLRNGPNPLPGDNSVHWFTGHGMIHGVRLNEGRAEWYRNRWVRTRELAGDPFLRADGTFDYTAVAANTHVLEHGGRLLALVENGFPYEITRELSTVGPCDFSGRLTGAMTAHPKCDPVTGDLHFFGYSALAPHLTYHRLSAAGELETSAEIPGAGPSMMHDFAITDRHALFLDLPMAFRPENMRGGGMPYRWDDAYPSRIGVMPLDRPGDVQWFPIDPCYVFHVGGARTDETGRIVLDACRYSAADAVVMWDRLGGRTPSADADVLGSAKLHRWVLDPATGRITETPRDDRPAEFPTLDDRLVGRSSRYLYTVSSGGGASAIVKYDEVGGGAAAYELGPDTVAGEAVFVPAQGGTNEDDGWLLTITTRRDRSASQLLVLDATDVAGRPVATVTLPRGVPAGFHGSWIADDAEEKR
jgi:carotenoid cleavage dioxygenase-like enzyme